MKIGLFSINKIEKYMSNYASIVRKNSTYYTSVLDYAILLDSSSDDMSTVECSIHK